jgi:hypothetical protein
MRLVFDQVVGFDNLNPARGRCSALRIVLDRSGDIFELEYQVVGNLERCQRARDCPER